MRSDAAAAQQLEQQLASTRRFGREQRAAADRGQMSLELGRRLFRARIDAYDGR